MSAFALGNFRNEEKILEGIFVSPRQPGRPRVLSNDRRYLLDAHSPQMKGGAECTLAVLNGNVHRRGKRKERGKGRKQNRRNR